MPGEERKFKRLTIVAFIPGCRREREEADSHAAATGVSAAGVCVPVEVGAAVGDWAAAGVAVGSVGVVAIEEGRGVAVGSAMFVPFGEGTGVFVIVGPDSGTAVNEEAGVTFAMDATVEVEESETLCVATAFVIVDDAGGAVTAGSAKDVLDAGTVIGTVVIVDIAI